MATISPYPVTWLCTCLLLLCSVTAVRSQHIPIANPSLQGTPATNKAPAGWKRINTADIQPGMYDITQPASDGDSYVGLHSGRTYIEGITQKLAGTMKAGYYYSTHFDLAYAPMYSLAACYGNLAIYGGTEEGELKELLWSSGAFTHTDWKRYNVSFRPTANYNSITLVAQYSEPCSRSKIGVALLLDNLSPWLYEQLKLEFSTIATCVGDNNGVVTAKVTGGAAPYRYEWQPGGANTASVANLSAGIYRVTVTDSKGISAQGEATVSITDLAGEAVVTPSRCFGDQDARITLNASGGIPPYRYYLNGSNTGSYTPVFEKLGPGAYTVQVKDEHGCAYELNDIQVEDPPRLDILGATILPCSCSEVNNGKIIPNVTGGIPPYEYRVNNGPWQADSVLAQLQPGNYRYEVRDKNGCTVAGSGEITSPYKNCFVIMPTAFSPNGDGINDVFRPKVYDDIHNYQLSIYNRWGNLLFRSNDPGIGWNGTHKGDRQMAQHYIYVCTYSDRNNMPQQLKGAVMLVR